MKTRPYLPLVLLAILALIAALWAGLLRLGWILPALTNNLASVHGALMVSGFLGTLVTLERAVALKQKWMFGAPLLTALGWIALLIAPEHLGMILTAIGSALGVAILFVIVRRETQLFTIAMFVGALAWLTGNVLWFSGVWIFQLVLWWQAFLVLTIAGERLELNRVLRPTRGALNLFLASAGLYLFGVIIAAFELNIGARVTGFAMLILCAWFLRNDIAIRNLRHKIELTRYIAWCLFLGFIWLGIGGALNLIFGAVNSGPLYDANLHVVFVGFVISMIFGHAPIIFPAILQTPIVFSRAFYVHLILLHASLALRVVADLAGLVELRKWGGLLNEVAIVVFLALTIASVAKGMSSKTEG